MALLALPPGDVRPILHSNRADSFQGPDEQQALIMAHGEDEDVSENGEDLQGYFCDEDNQGDGAEDVASQEDNTSEQDVSPQGQLH